MLKTNTIYKLHVLEGLKKLPDESVDMVITSPPYWALRDYGKTTDAVWGGDAKCKHVFGKPIRTKRSSGTQTAKVSHHKNGVGLFDVSSQFCRKCGAWKGQLGLEPSIDLFIEHTMEIFDEIRRVLKKCGTCWINLGDTYYTTSGIQKDNLNSQKYIQCTGINRAVKSRGNGELPSKCLSLIPFRFALAMINRGWILRNDIIWHKPSAVPSSAHDRFTVDYEHVFFFSKSKKYYFEKQIEPFKDSTLRKKAYRNKSHPQGRNKRCIWSISSRPLKEAHFAVYPEELCETPIKAGCPAEVCRKCGIPKLTRTTEANPDAFSYSLRDAQKERIKYVGRKLSKEQIKNYDRDSYVSKARKMVMFSCNCNAGFKPGIVLDPFMGSGTTAVVAKTLDRQFIGLELNPNYIKIAQRRIKNTPDKRKAKSKHRVNVSCRR